MHNERITTVCICKVREFKNLPPNLIGILLKTAIMIVTFGKAVAHVRMHSTFHRTAPKRRMAEISNSNELLKDF